LELMELGLGLGLVQRREELEWKLGLLLLQWIARSPCRGDEEEGGRERTRARGFEGRVREGGRRGYRYFTTVD